MKKLFGNTNLFRGNPILQFLAGGYLLYSAYRLVQLYRDGQIPRGSSWFCLLAAVVFAAVGAWLCVASYRAYRTSEPAAEPALDDEAPGSPEPEAGMPDSAASLPSSCDGDLAYALDHVVSCVLDHSGILRQFSRENYAASFAQYRAGCREVFLRAARAAEEKGIPAVVDALCTFLLDSLAARYEAAPRGERRELRDADKQILALYLVPAVRDLDLNISESFALRLPELWCARFHGSEFFPGDYETILEGFSRQSPGSAAR